MGLDPSLKGAALSLAPYTDQIALTDIYFPPTRKKPAQSVINQILPLIDKMGLPIFIGVRVLHGKSHKYEIMFGTPLYMAWEQKFNQALAATDSDVRSANSEIERWANIPCIVHSHETSNPLMMAREDAFLKLAVILAQEQQSGGLLQRSSKLAPRAAPPAPAPTDIKQTIPLDNETIPLDNETIRKTAAAIFSAHQSQLEIASDLMVAHGQVKMLAWGREPPWELRIAIPPPDSNEPLDWWQLWEMSSRLYGPRSWKVNGLRRLGGQDIPFKDNPNEVIDPQKLSDMRDQYWKKSAWGIFVELAMQKHAETGRTDFSSQHLWPDLRERIKKDGGRGVKNGLATEFTDRFNAEYFTMFNKRNDRAKA